jgi:hypothetical protein
MRTSPARRARLAALSCLIFATASNAQTTRTRTPVAARPSSAVVVDERLSALRDAPELSAALLQRLGRGRAVTVRGAKTSADGVVFYRVAVTSRTAGWVQREALVTPARAGEDERLLRLVRGSDGFDRIERAALFLELFPRSPLRAAALLILGDAAEAAGPRLSRDAASRLDAREMEAGGAPAHSYFLNYSGLDRYRRQGIVYVFDPVTKQFHYDGAAWREILRRHPQSAEAVEARKRLAGVGAPAKSQYRER